MQFFFSLDAKVQLIFDTAKCFGMFLGGKYHLVYLGKKKEHEKSLVGEVASCVRMVPARQGK